MRKSIFVLLTLFCGHSNPTIVGAQPSVEVRIIPTVLGLETVLLKDIDINQGFANAPPFLQITIDNPSAQATQVRLELSVLVGEDQVVRGTTREFTIPAGGLPRPLTNRDLFSATGPYRLGNTDIDESFFRDVLVIGRLPSNVYTFLVRLLDQGSGEINRSQDQARITNPRRLDLTGPGIAATGRANDCLELFTNLPQFRWISDLRLFRVVVAEARQGEDPESSLNQQPRFVRNYFIQDGTANSLANLNLVDIDGPVEVLPSTTFQYPATGTQLALRPGKTYLWRITGC